ncbi:MAG: DUF3015 family protein [Deltaproteobacteria bacterium]|nr:DUF3015 family protein [Deltaproteobacteria bacterium]
MRGIRIAIVVMMLATAPAGLALADDDIGCGVGTMIMEGQEGIPFKILGSWTNGVTFQSISITFGLLNCSGEGTITADASDSRVQHFASQNFDRLSVDMAKGGGEHLDVLATLLDVRDEQRADFAVLTQTHFEELFPSDDVTVGEMLSSLDQLMSESEIL